MGKDWRWIVSQIGSREHYGVPRGFERIGHLKSFYTDAWRRGLIGLLKYGNTPMRAFAGRFNPEIPTSKVVSFNVRAIVRTIHEMRLQLGRIDEAYDFYLRMGIEYDGLVVKHLQRRGKIDSACDAFFGYNTGSLRSIQYCKSQGIPTVLDQIDPAKTEEDIVAQEAEKWPGWQKIPGRISQKYWDHMKSEWAAADMVVVNSEWSRQALIQQGAAAEKIRVVPLTYQLDGVTEVARTPAESGPLKVLWLSTVILRKGIQYLIGAAKLLDPNKFKILVGGQVRISDEAVASAPSNVSFLGRITRNETSELYRQGDVFVLPTISDGFAITQVEAMAHGLPVIATPNCGKVVTDGVDGLIVPAGDAQALATAIETLHADRKRLAEMSRNALKRAGDFIIPKQALAIEAVLTEFSGSR